MSEPPVIYISGPMTGYPEWNFPAFKTAAQLWAKRDYAVISPADNFQGRTNLPWSTYMRMDIAQLLTCDAIYMMRGWPRSKGASLEHAIAKAIGLDVHYQSDTESRHSDQEGTF